MKYVYFQDDGSTLREWRLAKGRKYQAIESPDKMPKAIRARIPIAKDPKQYPALLASEPPRLLFAQRKAKREQDTVLIVAEGNDYSLYARSEWLCMRGMKPEDVVAGVHPDGTWQW